MSLRRMMPFVLINIIVSTTVVLLLLYWWDGRSAEDVTVTATAQAALAETPDLVDFTTPQQSRVDVTEEVIGGALDAAEEDEIGPTTHIVQAGETLGIISQQYDVAVEDIATANEIINVNTISVGQELLIPIGGLPTETPQPTAIPTEAPTPTTIATVEENEANVLVDITEVIGVGDLTSEAVRISNAGSRPLLLQGWQLEDEEGNVYTFVDVTLYGSSDAGAPSILIHTEAGQNGPSDLFWGRETAVWESGEMVTLRDSQGALQATYEIRE